MCVGLQALHNVTLQLLRQDGNETHSSSDWLGMVSISTT
jgi:hypothetical protein